MRKSGKNIALYLLLIAGLRAFFGRILHTENKRRAVPLPLCVPMPDTF